MGALQLLLVAVYAALSLYLVLSKPLQLPYSLHPIGTTLFIVLTTLGVSTSQTIRGKVAASKAAREAATLKHALLNWLAFFSLAGAQARGLLVHGSLQSFAAVLSLLNADMAFSRPSAGRNLDLKRTSRAPSPAVPPRNGWRGDGPVLLPGWFEKSNRGASSY